MSDALKEGRRGASGNDVGARLVRAAAPLVLLALGTVLAFRWALAVDHWHVMTDELLYVKVAQSIGENLSLQPSFRGAEFSNYGVLYPALLAPLVGWLDPGAAFRVAHGLGALLMASTVVPTYLLALYASRSRAVALAAAVPVAVMPWLLLSMNLMTEVLAYPLFVWAVFAVVRTVAEPSTSRDALALCLLVALFFTRTQFIFMFAVLPATVVLHEAGMRVSGRSPRQWVRQAGQALQAAGVGHPLMFAAFAVGIAALTLVTSITSLVGDYGIVVNSTELFPPGFRVSLFDHLTLVAFGVAAVPLVLTIAFVADTLWRPQDRRAHALAVCVLLTVTAVAVVATNFDLRFAELQARYQFYVAPLLMVAAACWVRAARRPLPVVAGAALLAGWIVAGTSAELDPSGSRFAFASPAQQGWLPFEGWVYRIGNAVGVPALDPAAVLALAAAVAAVGLAWLMRSGRQGLALAALGCGAAVWCAALTLYAGPRVFSLYEGQATEAIGGNPPLGERNWIDRAVGADADVALLPSFVAARDGRPTRRDALLQPGVWWEAELRNKSVRRSYVYGGANDFTPYRSETMNVRLPTGVLDTTGGQVPYLVVANTNVLVAPRGPVVARTRDLRLVRPVRPYRAAWATSGLGALGELPPRGPAEVYVYGPGGTGRRQVRVSLSVIGRTLDRPLAVTASGNTEPTRVFGRRLLRRTLCVPAARRGTVRLEVGGAVEARLIGVRVRVGRPC